MFFELQIAPRALIPLIQRQVQPLPICVPAEIPPGTLPGVDAKLGVLLVDHLEFPDGLALVRRVTRPAKYVRYSTYFNDKVWVYASPEFPTSGTQVAVPVSVTVVPIARVGSKPPSAGEGASFTILIWVNLWLTVAITGEASLSMSVADVDGAGFTIDDKLKAQLLAQLSTLALPAMAFDLAPLKSLGVRIVDGDVGLTKDLRAIVLRFECPTAGGVAVPAPTAYGFEQRSKWEAFYLGEASTLLADTGVDWAMSVEAQILQATTEAAIGDSIYSKAGISVTEPPETTWSGPSTLQATFAVDLVGACSTFWGTTWSPNVAITATAEFEVTTDTSAVGYLNSTVAIKPDIPTWDEIGCVAPAAVVGALTGAALGAVVGGPAGIIIGVIAGIIAAVVTALVVVASKATISVDAACVKTKEPSWHSLDQELSCSYPLDFKIGKSGEKLRATRLLSRSGTLSLGGVIDLGDAIRTPAVLELQADPDPFELEFANLCKPSGGGRAIFRATVDLWQRADANAMPLFLCDVRVRSSDDPSNQYGPYVRLVDVSPGPSKKADPGLPITIPLSAVWKQVVIDVPVELEAAFAKAPYDCILTIKSTGGVRRVRIGGITPLSDEEMTKLPETMKLARLAICEDPMAPWWEGGDLHLKWWPGGDPPAGISGLRHWDIAIKGLTPGERVTLSDEVRGLIAQGTATESGGAHLSGLIAVPRNHRSTAVLKRGNAPPQLAAGRQLSIVQSLLQLRSSVPLERPCVALSGERGPAGEPLFFVVTADELKVLDAHVPSRPLWRLRVPSAGVVGAARWGTNEVIAWGRGGIARIPLPGSRNRDEAEGASAKTDAAVDHDALTLPALSGAVVSRGRERFLFVLHNDRHRIMTFDAALRQVGSLDIRGAREIKPVGREWLAVRTDTTLQCVDIRQPTQLHPRGTYQMPNAVALIQQNTPLSHSSIGLLGPDDEVVLSFADADHIRPILRRPFTALAAQHVGKLSAFLGHGRSTLDIYEHARGSTIL